MLRVVCFAVFGPVVLVLLAAGPAAAQSPAASSWPNRPITLIVPYAAGGPVDTVGRIVAQRMSELLPQQMVVENVGGAGGMVGSNRVAKGTPDGYLVLFGGSAVLTQVTNLYKRPLYTRSRISAR